MTMMTFPVPEWIQTKLLDSLMDALDAESASGDGVDHQSDLALQPEPGGAQGQNEQPRELESPNHLRIQQEEEECEQEPAPDPRVRPQFNSPVANTERNTIWGIGVWKKWCKDKAITEDILNMTEDIINSHMAKFVQEARQTDGSEYSASSLQGIVVAIQRFLRENNRPSVSFFNKSNPTFEHLRAKRDAKLDELRQSSACNELEKEQPAPTEVESKLWEDETFSRSTAPGLTKVVMWYIFKLFGVESAAQHRKLETSQFTFGGTADESGEYLQFTRLKSDTRKRKQSEPSVVKIPAKPDLREKCAVSCFKYYLSLIPETGYFYRQPRGDSNPAKYSKTRLGIHNLEKHLRDLKRRCTPEPSSTQVRPPLAECDLPDDPDLRPPPAKRTTHHDHGSNKENVSLIQTDPYTHLHRIINNGHIENVSIVYNMCQQ